MGQLFDRLRSLTQNQTEHIRDSGQDQVRIADGRQFNNADLGGGGGGGGHRERDPRLPYTSGPGERYEPGILAPEQVADERDVAVSANQGRAGLVQSRNRVAMPRQGRR